MLRAHTPQRKSFEVDLSMYLSSPTPALADASRGSRSASAQSVEVAAAQSSDVSSSKVSSVDAGQIATTDVAGLSMRQSGELNGSSLTQ